MLCDGAALQHSVFKVVLFSVFKVVLFSVFKVVLLQHRSFDALGHVPHHQALLHRLRMAAVVTVLMNTLVLIAMVKAIVLLINSAAPFPPFPLSLGSNKFNFSLVTSHVHTLALTAACRLVDCLYFIYEDLHRHLDNSFASCRFSRRASCIASNSHTFR